MGVIWETGFWSFFFLVFVIGGGSAYMAGRAVARGWQSYTRLVFYCFLLALTARFLMFALFEGTLLSLHYFVVAFIVLVACALLGHRVERTRQMVMQYRWLNKRTSPLTWKDA